MAIQLFQHYLLKRLFSIELLWHVCQKLIDHKCLGLFLGFQFYSIDLYVILMSICYFCFNMKVLKLPLKNPWDTAPSAWAQGQSADPAQSYRRRDQLLRNWDQCVTGETVTIPSGHQAGWTQRHYLSCCPWPPSSFPLLTPQALWAGMTWAFASKADNLQGSREGSQEKWKGRVWGTEIHCVLMYLWVGKVCTPGSLPGASHWENWRMKDRGGEGLWVAMLSWPQPLPISSTNRRAPPLPSPSLPDREQGSPWHVPVISMSSTPSTPSITMAQCLGSLSPLHGHFPFSGP